LIGSYLAQEGAICRIVDGFIFEAVGRVGRAPARHAFPHFSKGYKWHIDAKWRTVRFWHLADINADAEHVYFPA
jgi:hypothetical protein